MKYGVTGKETIRNEIDTCIRALPQDRRLIMDAEISTTVTMLEVWERVDTVLGYVAMESEVDPGALLRAAQRAGKRVGLPRIEKGNDRMIYRTVSASSIPPENRQPPADAPETPIDDRTLVIVPGRAFDRNGYHIGSGSGYYDRFLATLEAKVTTIGVGYACQLRSEIPRAAWDVPVQIVVTESESCFCRRTAANTQKN